MLRSHDIRHIGRSRPSPSRPALALAFSALLPACTISMPMIGSKDEPATTGSIANRVEVERPLPQALAYSDAAKIGQAAAGALWQDHDAGIEWLNAATGSSGTIEKSAANAENTETCRPFRTIVTSIGGVHSYSGQICRGDDGDSIVRLAATGENQTS